MTFNLLSTPCLTERLKSSLNSLFMGEEEREMPVSALPLKVWLAGQGHGAKAALARKLRIDHGRLTNWLRRGIPHGKVYAIAAEMGLSYEQYRARAGVPSAMPLQGSLETAALIDDFERLPAGLKAFVAFQTTELREIYESLPAYMQAGLKRRPTTESYKEWEQGIRELMAEYRKDKE